jgi:hypothetical protein
MMKSQKRRKMQMMLSDVVQFQICSSDRLSS